MTKTKQLTLNEVTAAEFLADMCNMLDTSGDTGDFVTVAFKDHDEWPRLMKMELYKPPSHSEAIN